MPIGDVLRSAVLHTWGEAVYLSLHFIGHVRALQLPPHVLVHRPSIGVFCGERIVTQVQKPLLMRHWYDT